MQIVNVKSAIVDASFGRISSHVATSDLPFVDIEHARRVLSRQLAAAFFCARRAVGSRASAERNASREGSGVV